MRPADIQIDRILNVLNTIAPFSLAEEWDNVGLLIGDPAQAVTGIVIGLDPTAELLDQALALGANLVITHHPIIFQPLKTIRTDTPAGALIAKAITAKIAIIACHTNLDVVARGVSHTLAHCLGLTGLTPLVPSPGAADLGFGTLGKLTTPVSGQTFVACLCRAIGVAGVSVAGPLPAMVERVALCGGSGSEFATQARAQGAEIYITAEVKHHVARWAEAAGFCVVDAGHFATEHPIAKGLARMLAEHLADLAPHIPVHWADKEKNPFSIFMAENDQQPNQER
jgi:dinuclear metal center YbgI/SA1388 family protein